MAESGAEVVGVVLLFLVLSGLAFVAAHSSAAPVNFNKAQTTNNRGWGGRCWYWYALRCALLVRIASILSIAMFICPSFTNVQTIIHIYIYTYMHTPD